MTSSLGFELLTNSIRVVTGASEPLQQFKLPRVQAHTTVQIAALHDAPVPVPQTPLPIVTGLGPEVEKGATVGPSSNCTSISNFCARHPSMPSLPDPAASCWPAYAPLSAATCAVRAALQPPARIDDGGSDLIVMRVTCCARDHFAFIIFFLVS